MTTIRGLIPGRGVAVQWVAHLLYHWSAPLPELV